MTNNKINKKIKNKYKEDWWLFCNNYLSISRLACTEIIHQQYSMFWSEKKGDIGPKRYYPFNLYIAAIYNLKHSIEIFLKYFYIIIEDKFPDIGKDGHSIEKYLEIFNSKYKVDLINKTIKKAYNEKKKSKYTLDVAEMETGFSAEWMNNVARISMKYFNCEDIKKHISNSFTIKDVSNDGFRYPINKLTIELNYTNIVNKITKEDMKKVLEDIGELDNAFSSLRFLVEVYHDVK